MGGREQLLRAFEREPWRTFSTTALVAIAYPNEMRELTQPVSSTSRGEKRTLQAAKSKLHRRTLYYLAALEAEKVIEVVRVDAHGEKQYRIADLSAANSAPAHKGVPAAPQSLRTHFLEEELERGIALLYQENEILNHVNAVCLDASFFSNTEKLVRAVELFLRCVNDVVCLVHMEEYINKQTSEECKSLLDSLALLTLDEVKAVCLVVDARKAPVAEFTRAYAQRLPPRIHMVFAVDARAILSEPFLSAVSYLQSRNEKINVHFLPNDENIKFVGTAGVYTLPRSTFASDSSRIRPTVAVASQLTLLLDVARLKRMAAHDVRKVCMNAAKVIFGVSSQQRMRFRIPEAFQREFPESQIVFTANNYLRLWNYDWEEDSRMLESAKQEMQKIVELQATIYDATHVAAPPEIYYSSTFAKAHKHLSARVYRKWMVTGTSDLLSESFERYVASRRKYLSLFDGVDRFRVFRTGAATPQQIANEIITVGMKGFPLVTIDFEPLRGVRRLTEFFG